MLSKPTLPITRHGESAATLRLPMQALLSGQRRAEFMGALQTIATILQRTSHRTVVKTE